jgi:hypothetical protein
MRFPNHIIIDVAKSNLINTNQYWILKYFFSFNKSKLFLKDLSFHKSLFFNHENLFLNKFNQNQTKFTLKYNYSKLYNSFNQIEKETFLKLNTPRIKVKNKLINENYVLLNLENINYDIFKIKKIYKSIKTNSTLINKTTSLWTLFNINFLRKEKMYTKLKYSRVPQYDIVSGGAAALLAGFLGFLISEKFGFELVDSGDFYFLFMYLVFLFFSLRLFLKIMTSKDSSWNFFSLNWLINFYRTIFILTIKFIKIFIK